MPIYYLPQVNVFPNFIHQCCENYDPNQRAVLAPSGTVLFHITPQAINHMLNFEPTKPLAPLSMKLLLDQGAKLPSSEITRIASCSCNQIVNLGNLLLIYMFGSLKQEDCWLT